MSEAKAEEVLDGWQTWLHSRAGYAGHDLWEKLPPSVHSLVLPRSEMCRGPGPTMLQAPVNRAITELCSCDLRRVYRSFVSLCGTVLSTTGFVAHLAMVDTELYIRYLLLRTREPFDCQRRYEDLQQATAYPGPPNKSGGVLIRIHKASVVL